jgi:prevent-host-death family protein
MATLPKSPPKQTKQKAKIKVPLAVAAKSRTVRETVVPAAKAKAHLLELLDTVDREHSCITITKRGRAVAQLVPIQERKPRDIFGYMKGTGRITGDIVGPEPDVWEAMS